MTQTPEEFFAAQTQRPKCYLCRIPVREEMERGFGNGVPVAVLVRWVATEHPALALSEGAVGRHFRERHHERQHVTES